MNLSFSSMVRVRLGTGPKGEPLGRLVFGVWGFVADEKTVIGNED